MDHTIVTSLMNQTVNAYSRERYSEEAWEHAIILLLTFGFTEEQCFVILMSKHMRWAADKFGKIDRNGETKCNGMEIIQHHRESHIDINKLMAEHTASQRCPA